MKPRSAALLLLLFLAALPASPSAAQDGKQPAAPPAWVFPQDAKCAGRRLTMHEPLMTSYDPATTKTSLRFPAAVTDPLGRMVYGAFEATGLVHADLAGRLIKVDTLDAGKATFPGMAEKDAAAVQAGLGEALPKSLLLRLEVLTTRPSFQAPAATKIDLKPPQFVVRRRPAVLVQVDGEPVLLDIENVTVQYLANSASDVFRDTKTDLWYLLVDGMWAQAKTLAGPWRKADNGPPSLLSQLPLTHPRGHIRRYVPGTPEYAKRGLVKETRELPEVIVTDKASELLLLAGDPLYGNVRGVKGLLSVLNTESDLFLHLPSNLFYLLVAGRWFSASDIEGPWTAAETLPEEFAKIPRDSVRGHVVSCVPGTPEANEACALASVEEHVAIGKSSPAQVLFEGKDPVVAPLDGDLKTFTNTEDDCIGAGGAWYVCQRGAWFTSADGRSGWKAAGTLPDAVRKLGETSGIFHVTGSRPAGIEGDDAVFAVTAGYYGVFLGKGAPVYGTGAGRRGVLRNSNWYPTARSWGENRWYDASLGVFLPRSVRPKPDGKFVADEWSPYTASYGRVNLYGCRYDQGGRRMFPFNADSDEGRFETAVTRPDVWSLWGEKVRSREGIKAGDFPLGDRSGEVPPADPRLVADETGHVWRTNDKGVTETFADGAWKAGKAPAEAATWLATLARVDARPAQWKSWRERKAAAIPVNPEVTPSAK